jgi:DNA uptake protein ComE-like DNA-binding protein
MISKPHATINLNTVEEKVLVQKLAISARLAKRIIDLRPYHSIDQLNKVWGIDQETLQRILPLVSVKQEATSIPPPQPEEEPVQRETPPPKV